MGDLLHLSGTYRCMTAVPRWHHAALSVFMDTGVCTVPVCYYFSALRFECLLCISV